MKKTERLNLEDEIRKLLEDADINRLTPVEALLKLQEIKSKLK
jgi:DNA mismatch repair protein MutS